VAGSGDRHTRRPGPFVLTLRLDRAAYQGRLQPPTWVISGTADAARQILTSIAASVITVVGIVFSITIVTLTLASTQFGPRMLRNFIRDRGTQLTLGTFVATFVYCVVVLVSIGPGDRGEFVPHISITTAFGLVLIDLAVLIYFIHHIATQIQLPQVIASIAKDLAQAVALQSSDQPRFATRRPAHGPSLDELLARIETSGSVIRTPKSGYLQFIRHQTLVRVATEVDAVIRLPYRPGHFLVEGRELASVWPPAAAEQVASYRSGDRTAPHPDTGHRLRRRSARRDRDPGAIAGGQRHVHRANVHRLAGRLPVQDRTGVDAHPSSSRPPRSHPRHLRSSQLRAAGATGV
jgi:uncharacterized membrane protein